MNHHIFSLASRFRFFTNRSTIGKEVIKQKKKSEPVSYLENPVRISWVWYECS